MIKLTYEEFFPFNTDNTLFASKIIITIIVKVFFYCLSIFILYMG